MRKERKHYTAEEKVAILRRHLLDRVPAADLCEEPGLQLTSPLGLLGGLEAIRRFGVVRVAGILLDELSFDFDGLGNVPFAEVSFGECGAIIVLTRRQLYGALGKLNCAVEVKPSLSQDPRNGLQCIDIVRIRT